MSFQPEPTPGNTRWFVNDRFGMFIHWGLYAAPGRHEWVRNIERITEEDYRKYFDHFDPDLYEPRAWAAAAKAAGMRYVVITAKHHEGFCLWDSALTDYKATNTPAGRDLLRPLLDACREEGLKTGVYYSLIDWHHPEFPVDGLHPQRDDVEFRKREEKRDIRRYAEYMRGQVRELLTGYGKIDIIWFDFSYPDMIYDGMKGKGAPEWQARELIDMIRELAPEIIVNNRTGIAQDIHTPEQEQPQGWLHVDGKPVVWEACQTLNGSWGYHRDNLDWKSPDMLVRMLIDTVSKGGNMLLNVGPTARGYMDDRALDTLYSIGEWTTLHGRSIYGATMSELAPPPDCRYTVSGDRLYLHIFSWPFKTLLLPELAGRVEYARFLHDASEVQFKTTGDAGHIELNLPIQQPEVIVPVVELFLK